MGLRIRKMCGYGLTDLAEDDPRVNWDSAYFNYRSSDFSVDEFLELAEGRDGTYGRLDRIMVQQWREQGKEDPDVADCFEIGNADSGLTAACARTLACPDWYRSDDTIDYLEAGGEPDSSVRVLDYGIFPYDGLYMDARTGEPVKEGLDIRRWVRIADRLGEESYDTQVQAAYAGVFEEENKWTLEDAREFLVPNVPEDIRNVVDYLDVFTSADEWKNLRPMICTWWS